MISIHAPREGSDIIETSKKGGLKIFQSTLPVRGATMVPGVVGASGPFQSTLPVRGATAEYFADWVKDIDFNPRSP